MERCENGVWYLIVEEQPFHGFANEMPSNDSGRTLLLAIMLHTASQEHLWLGRHPPPLKVV
jgi:hypothetical protein